MSALAACAQPPFLLKPKEKVLHVQSFGVAPAAEILLPELRPDVRRFVEGLLLRPRMVLMAGSKSNFLAKKMVEEALGAVAYVSATNVYTGVWTAALDDTSTGATGSEATYGSYARTLVGTSNNQTDAFNAATGTTTATVTNKNAITLPTSTGTANTLIYAAFVDSATVGAGNILYWLSTNSVTINTGDTPKVNAGGFSVVED